MDKVWLGFDVDETLGCFNYLFPILDFLFMDAQPAYEPAQHAFQYLVQNIAENDMTQSKHTGLFRPGLYEFFHDMINPLMDREVVQGMVLYSNNGNPHILDFCAKVIGRWMEKETPFCYLVHRLHPIRQNASGQIRSLDKTWNILSKSFIAGGCPAPEITKTFFYDDSSQHRDLIQRLTANYIKVVAYHGPFNIGKILTLVLDAFLKAGLLRKREGANNNALQGDDYIFDPVYIHLLHAKLKENGTPSYLKRDLQTLFSHIGDDADAVITWKGFQQALQVLFKEQDTISKRQWQHVAPNTRPTAVNIKQWYTPLVSPPVEAKKANSNIDQRIRNMMRRAQNATQNRARSASVSTLRGNTAKKAPGRSLANMAANNTPKSMENEMKAAFGLGGGRRRTRRSSKRKNASRKVKRHSRR